MLITTLTKRMAEDLTDYLHEHGVKVRYLHSDIETVERVEIIRDLRLGKFDVLVGINLLREGLDMPEVSLVAILDADKEGFLRSDGLADPDHRPGRAQPERPGDPVRRPRDRFDAARDRRDRPPPGEAGRVQPAARHHAAVDRQGGAGHHGRRPRRWRRGMAAAALAADEGDLLLAPEQAMKRIKKLEAEMYKHARNLEFEEAARIRDQIDSCGAAFGGPGAVSG